MFNTIKNFIAGRKIDKLWATPEGKDCIDLDMSLCEWLGERLIFLSCHTNSYPHKYAGHEDDFASEEYLNDLAVHGMALLTYTDRYAIENLDDEQAVIAKAQDALRWVADNLPALWD